MQDIMSVIILRSSVRSQGRSNDKYFSSTSTSSTCFQSDISPSLQSQYQRRGWKRKLICIDLCQDNPDPRQSLAQWSIYYLVNIVMVRSQILLEHSLHLSLTHHTCCLSQWCSLYSHKFRLIKLMLDLYLSLFLAVPDTVLRQLSWIERDKPCNSE